MKNPGVRVRKILVVEDEPTISEVCRRVLTGEGFAVEIAVNGQAAQDMIAGEQYVICLIDIRTPAMNGKELYRWLKEKHPQVADRVIFTTGDVMAGDIRSFLEQVARPLLPKPFAPGELTTIVKQTLKEV